MPLTSHCYMSNSTGWRTCLNNDHLSCHNLTIFDILLSNHQFQFFHLSKNAPKRKNGYAYIPNYSLHVHIYIGSWDNITQPLSISFKKVAESRHSVTSWSRGTITKIKKYLFGHKNHIQAPEVAIEILGSSNCGHCLQWTLVVNSPLNFTIFFINCSILKNLKTFLKSGRNIKPSSGASHPREDRHICPYLGTIYLHGNSGCAYMKKTIKDNLYLISFIVQKHWKSTKQSALKLL